MTHPVECFRVDSIGQPMARGTSATGDLLSGQWWSYVLNGAEGNTTRARLRGGMPALLACRRLHPGRTRSLVSSSDRHPDPSFLTFRAAGLNYSLTYNRLARIPQCTAQWLWSLQASIQSIARPDGRASWQNIPISIQTRWGCLTPRPAVHPVLETGIRRQRWGHTSDEPRGSGPLIRRRGLEGPPTTAAISWDGRRLIHHPCHGYA